TTVNVLSNDTLNGASTLTVTSGANGATVAVNNNGTAGTIADDSITYTSAAGFTGADTFTYSIATGSATATATVTVTVSAASSGASFVSYTGGNYLQTFDSLPAVGSATANLGTISDTTNGPWNLNAAPWNFAGVDGWAFAHNAETGSNQTASQSIGAGG